MAVEAVDLSGTADANSTLSLVSDIFWKPVRLLAIVVSYDGATATDTFSVFTTHQTETPTAPAPGDPPYLRALNIPVRVTSAFAISIPVPQRRTVLPPFRIAFVYNNTDATNARKVSCTVWYDTEE